MTGLCATHHSAIKNTIPVRAHEHRQNGEL